MKKLSAILFVAILGCGFFAWSQDAATATPFKAGVNLGTDVLPTGPGGTTQSWTRLGFQPDLAFGKFGVGLDLTLHFMLYQTPDQAVTLYPGDWVPNYNGSKDNIIDVYLPKLMYVRYGLKGSDPYFAKLGSIPVLTLGNGFIMGQYTNMSFYPEQRIIGADLGLDGATFNFPLVGAEVVLGNLARFDVIGAHVYVRPLVMTEIPIVKNLQVGVTYVLDNSPYMYSSTTASLKTVGVMGFDAMVPIFSNPGATMAAFTETAFEPNSSMGFMLGVGGKLISIFNYGLQLRYLAPGFIPVYFDSNYDSYRAAKATYMSLPVFGSGFAGWFASIGSSLLEDKISVSASLDGPVGATPNPVAQSTYPHMRAVAHLGEGLLPGVYADATYEKYYLGLVKGFFGDLIDPNEAIVGLAINYKTGSSVLTLLYNAKYVPSDSTWKVTSSLQAALKF